MHIEELFDACACVFNGTDFHASITHFSFFSTFRKTCVISFITTENSRDCCCCYFFGFLCVFGSSYSFACIYWKCQIAFATKAKTDFLYCIQYKISIWYFDVFQYNRCCSNTKLFVWYIFSVQNVRDICKCSQRQRERETKRVKLFLHAFRGKLKWYI